MIKYKAKLVETKGSVSVAACVCVLVSLALIFSGLRLYEITSTSASSQEVADASSMAAENEVAKFTTVANAADATVLTMNIAQLITYSVGVVAACSGNVATSGEFISKANEIGQARAKFSTRAKKALNTYQKGLSTLAALSASRVARENGGQQSSVCGFAILIPESGEEIVSDESGLNSTSEDLENNIGDLQEKGSEVAEKEKKINELKEEGYKLDCGANPGYCLYERASSLANLSANKNPFYASPDTWDFNVAFERSLAYYQDRADQENPKSYASEREKARSYLRVDYYSYCYKKLDEAKKSGVDGSGLYSWPVIYHEKDGFRASERYRESIYPVTLKDGKKVMHSARELSCASGYTYLASCADYDNGNFQQCDTCEFSTNNVGNIGSATTNTKIGFEYYFQRLAKLAREYQDKRSTFDDDLSELKDLGKSFFDKLSDFFSAAKNARIRFSPPGKDGAISVVLDKSDVAQNTSFASSFISTSTSLGERLAFGGSKLEIDESDSGVSLICERVASLANTNSNSPVASAWKSAAFAFADGTLAIRQAFSNAANSSSVKTLTHSAGGKWALNFMSQFASSLGLDGADLGAYKPVIVSTKSIVESSDSVFATKFASLQEATLKNSNSATTPLSYLTTEIEERANDFLPEPKLVIGKVDLPILGEIDLSTTFDSAENEYERDRLRKAIDDIEDVYASVGGKTTWQ